MTSDANRDARYELRGLDLFVNDEKQPVSRESVKVAVARYWGAGGPPPTWRTGVARISKTLAGIIVSLEAKLASIRLEAALRG